MDRLVGFSYWVGLVWVKSDGFGFTFRESRSGKRKVKERKATDVELQVVNGTWEGRREQEAKQYRKSKE